MNIKAMLEAQKELDQANFEKAGITEYPLEEVKIAYRVELGEALQEAKFWKYWKKSKGEVDREKLLEELADCLHFALSLQSYKCRRFGYEFTFDEEDLCIIDRMKKQRIGFLIDRLFNYPELVYNFALGVKLGFTLEELEQAYWDKNKINWDRVNGDY